MGEFHQAIRPHQEFDLHHLSIHVARRRLNGNGIARDEPRAIRRTCQINKGWIIRRRHSHGHRGHAQAASAVAEGIDKVVLTEIVGCGRISDRAVAVVGGRPVRRQANTANELRGWWLDSVVGQHPDVLRRVLHRVGEIVRRLRIASGNLHTVGNHLRPRAHERHIAGLYP